jgi:hypothetical protein
MDKTTLKLYRKAFFEEAKLYEKIYNSVQYSTLYISIISLYSDGPLLFIFMITGASMQLLIFITKHRNFNSKSNALELLRVEMLNLISEGEQFEHEISKIIGSASRYTQKIFNKYKLKTNEIYYNSGGHLYHDDYGKLIIMVQENSYWNCILYNKSSRLGFAFFYTNLFIAIITIIVMAYLKMPIQFSIIKVILCFISFVGIWESLERYFKWHNASEKMLSIDNTISRSNLKDKKIAISVFTEYHIALNYASDIPNKIYIKHHDQLEEGWSLRLSKI